MTYNEKVVKYIIPQLGLTTWMIWKHAKVAAGPVSLRRATAANCLKRWRMQGSRNEHSRCCRAYLKADTGGLFREWLKYYQRPSV